MRNTHSTHRTHRTQTLRHQKNVQIVACTEVRGQNGHDGDRHPVGVQRVPNHHIGTSSASSASSRASSAGIESARVGKRLFDERALGGRTVLRGELQLLRHGLGVEPVARTQSEARMGRKTEKY
jgi:hypothetical protein